MSPQGIAAALRVVAVLGRSYKTGTSAPKAMGDGNTSVAAALKTPEDAPKAGDGSDSSPSEPSSAIAEVMALSKAIQAEKDRRAFRTLPLDVKVIHVRGPSFVVPTKFLHRGTDYGVVTNTPVYATAPGQVCNASWAEGYGNCIIIDHGVLKGDRTIEVSVLPLWDYDGDPHYRSVGTDAYRVACGARLFTLYAHLNAYRVKLGERVGTSALIALSGDTGPQGTEPHLHYELYTRTSSQAARYIDKANDVIWQPEALGDLVSDLATA